MAISGSCTGKAWKPEQEKQIPKGHHVCLTLSAAADAGRTGEWQYLMVSHGWQVQGGTSCFAKIMWHPNLGHSLNLGHLSSVPNSLDVVTEWHTELLGILKRKFRYIPGWEAVALPSIMRTINRLSDAVKHHGLGA